ncbi:NADPH-dependent FMN reductase [Lysinibacillus endophyticus]|uniref:NAD(P)H-dependent oxidoreductase n=1 Tax=Ureibacillus endophyticus TaxID=1978490 RepID=A0A494YUS4_9BACL|nr:NAD(P)H-dependent oxidoreductase [Lysinibacillus endophyticus]MCP1144361.1 NAD(P)H-dependent oxidoreductase [Lysinibacillus endophyticus]RKQ13859.1 NAD(P)H-dependent oxidoreductase [Lysinibacillus endophyticus]
MVKVGIISGSLRKESYSKKIGENVAQLFPQDYETQFIDIGNLPLYNEDIDNENTSPEEYTTFRNTLKEMDAILFITPEYNRSIPGALKNAIDVGSRPYGQSAWNGKPAAIISQSMGNLSGFGANHHLRQCLVFLNMPILQQPEAYIANSSTLFDDNGKFKEEKTTQFLQVFVDAFVDLINRYNR